MANLETNLNDFFTYVITFIKDWSSCINDTKDSLKALKNQSEQLESTYSCSWDQALLKKFPDIKDRLVHKIISGLEEEIKILNNVWTRLSNLDNELQFKLDSIERNTRNQCLANFSMHGMIVPPLYKLIEYAEDIVRHYHILLIQLTSALNLMDYKNQKSILNIERIFHRSATVPDNLKNILSSVRHLISVPFSISQLDET